ncbi:MAG: acyl-CoA dehydrogenase family protein, partial [Gammaproteobacteria bacterium]|nr:acyl-CoA dehydrogenase family protein [Gammaproteobacteria bacterium]
MNSVLIVVVLLATFLSLAASSARQSVWLIVGAVVLTALTLASSGVLPGALLAAAWLGWLGLAASQVRSLRHALLTRPALSLFRRKLPPISETEQAALDAGTVWWDAELFGGAPDWSQLAALPMPALSEAERAFLDGPVEQLCAMLDDWQISHELNDLPPRVWDFIRSERFFAMIIPERFGGLGFSARAHSEVIMKLTSRCSAAAVTVMVPNSLGPAELLLRYGTEAQRDYYLPRLASGDEIPCFGLTNPLAGSDAASLPDHGVVCRGEYLGEEVLGIRANWEKRYITLGPVATLLGLAIRVEDPDGLLAGTGQPGITVALVPTDLAGIDIGRRHSAGRQAFQNGPNSGTDVFIPMDMLIGGQARCGEGWRMLMNCLAAGRAVSLPASSTGG